jgi:hypothetical protein
MKTSFKLLTMKSRPQGVSRKNKVDEKSTSNGNRPLKKYSWNKWRRERSVVVF